MTPRPDRAVAAVHSSNEDVMDHVEAQHRAWESRHGHCGICGSGDCPGVEVLGVHCGECRYQFNPRDVVARDDERDGSGVVVALTFRCPKCDDDNCQPVFKTPAWAQGSGR